MLRRASALPSRFAGDPAEAFFAERRAGRREGRTRSLGRARAVLPALGIDPAQLLERGEHAITVVGSKGKGTAATYASAALAASGRCVGTLTSPGLRSNRERIRIDGEAIDAAEYQRLVRRVLAAVDAAEARGGLPHDGYLSPTGLFTLAALRHFLDSGCDAWVLEAGMGGAHDEVALVASRVVAVTPIFAEHMGILGSTVTEVAREKLGVASPATRAVLSGPQRHPEAAAEVQRRVSPRAGVVPPSLTAGRELPPEPVRSNALLGIAAAAALLEEEGAALDAGTALPTLASIQLPGRLSRHRRGEQLWLVDAATNGAAARAALEHLVNSGPAPSAVLVCLPDGKDIDGVLGALRGQPVTQVRTEAEHLTFSASPAALPTLHDLDADRLGPAVLALGTVTFVGDVLELLEVETERSFTRLA